MDSKSKKDAIEDCREEKYGMVAIDGSFLTADGIHTRPSIRPYMRYTTTHIHEPTYPHLHTHMHAHMHVYLHAFARMFCCTSRPTHSGRVLARFSLRIAQPIGSRVRDIRHAPDQ